jgi:hypothetical protein
MSAPCSSADVTKPARKECPEKIAGSSPAIGGVAFDDLGNRLVGEPLPPDAPALSDRYERRTHDDPRRREPRLKHLDRLNWPPVGTGVSRPTALTRKGRCFSAMLAFSRVSDDPGDDVLRGASELEQCKWALVFI